MLQAVLTRESPAGRIIEFATLRETSVVRTQVEIRNGLVFMRAKCRTYVFT